MKDFTYFLQKNQLKISSIRFVNFNDYTIITIYYPYLALNFTKPNNNKFILPENNNYNYIFEYDTDHKTDFHKVTDPYDWHVHIKILTKKLIPTLDYFFKNTYLSINDLNNIKTILHSDISTLQLNPDTIQYNGSKSIQKLKDQKYYINLLNIYYDTFKYDISKPYYGMANYMIRMCQLKFKLKKNILKQLENLYNLLKSNNFKTQIKTIFPEANIPDIDYTTYESKYKLISRLNKQDIDIDVNHNLKSILILGVICHKQYSNTTLTEYINRRLNVEFGWLLYQLFKINNMEKKIIPNIKTNKLTKKQLGTLLRDISNINAFQYNSINDYMKICRTHVSVNGITKNLSIILKSNRISPLN